MTNRTDDLANQARERARAEERRASVSGNSDAAEPPRALLHEQERKETERQEKSEGGSDGEPSSDAPTPRSSDETTIASTQVTAPPPGQDAPRTPSPGPAPVETAPDVSQPAPSKGPSQADIVEAGNKAAK